MKKIILVVLIFCFISCDNDDAKPVKNDYSFFLNLTSPQFRAKVNNAQLSWEFKVGQYQMSSSSLIPSGNFDNPQRLLRFVLNQESGNNQFVISTPIFDTSSAIAYNEVFGLGLKKIGTYSEAFHLSVLNKDVRYQICSSDANYKIEVLKTEEIISESPNPTILKVWFKLDNIKLNYCNPNSNIELNDGLIIAHFIGYKSE